MLVMTATPIPRTLTMSLYGDLDVSTLDELPKGRGKIITVVRNADKLPDAVKFMREHLEAGRQAYIVYPLIDSSDKLEAKAAAAEFEKWQSLLAPMPCALLHGRIPPEEKDAIMERFRSGETKALIATTVIEVGIDVPNSNMMLIENAERFGLAQLHQLRGRVGRGGHKSYCILLTETEDPEAISKLQVLERTSNGFEIAEADWELRGPGDLLGTAQSGMPPLRIGNLIKDQDLMHRSPRRGVCDHGTGPETRRSRPPPLPRTTLDHTPRRVEPGQLGCVFGTSSRFGTGEDGPRLIRAGAPTVRLRISLAGKVTVYRGFILQSRTRPTDRLRLPLRYCLLRAFHSLFCLFVQRGKLAGRDRIRCLLRHSDNLGNVLG